MNHVARIEAIKKECSGVWGVSNISSWERDRLEEWKNLPTLSTKQERIVRMPDLLSLLWGAAQA